MKNIFFISLLFISNLSVAGREGGGGLFLSFEGFQDYKAQSENMQVAVNQAITLIDQLNLQADVNFPELKSLKKRNPVF